MKVITLGVRLVFISVCYLLLGTTVTAQTKLTLEQAIELANQQDDKIRHSQLDQQRMLALADSHADRPDPVMGLSLVNLPTDGFSFQQEAMTQMKVSVTQALSRGDKVALTREVGRLQAAQHPYLQQEFKLRNRLVITQLWIDILKVQAQRSRLEGDIHLLDQLKQATESSYASGYSGTRQHHIVQIDVQQAQLSDKIWALDIERQNLLGKLQGFLLDTNYEHISLNEMNQAPVAVTLNLSDGLFRNTDALVETLSQHPSVRSISTQFEASQTGVDLARQNYEPQWKLTASYGHRADDPNGVSRADFFSVGVGVDLPVFSQRENDQKVKAAKLKSASIETQRRIVLKQLISDSRRINTYSNDLADRLQNYQNSILIGLQAQADSALSAYTHDNGEFSDVLRSRLALIDAHLELIAINALHQQTRAQLGYLLSSANPIQER